MIDDRTVDEIAESWAKSKAPHTLDKLKSMIAGVWSEVDAGYVRARIVDDNGEPAVELELESVTYTKGDAVVVPAARTIRLIKPMLDLDDVIEFNTTRRRKREAALLAAAFEAANPTDKRDRLVVEKATLLDKLATVDAKLAEVTP